MRADFSSKGPVSCHGLAARMMLAGTGEAGGVIMEYSNHVLSGSTHSRC
jgi:hypothetical protein